MNISIGFTLLLCVYMPTNYGDENSRELYMDCLGKLHAVMYDSDIIHTLIAGDFYCSPALDSLTNSKVLVMTIIWLCLISNV